MISTFLISIFLYSCELVSGSNDRTINKLIQQSSNRLSKLLYNIGFGIPLDSFMMIKIIRKIKKPRITRLL